jgi:hypothetical protein
MKIEDSNKFGKLSIDRLLKFEKLIGASLPDDYRQFLIDHNGGKPLPCDFYISEEEGENSIHHFYGLHDGPIYASLEESFKVYKGRMPDSMISFAYDPFGNAICIGLRGDDLGKIFFWDHELETADGKQPYYDNISRIAKSFKKFIDDLFEWIDPNENQTKKIIRTKDIEALNNLLDSGYEIEKTNEYDKTLIEEAAIAGNNNMIRILFERGAQLRNALSLAEGNAEFFDSHISTVRLIEELKNQV